MILSRRHYLLSALSLLTLSGCGYQLRGVAARSDRPLPFRIYLASEGTDAELIAQTRRALQAFGADLVSERKQAELVVNLGPTTQQSVISAIGSFGEISARLFVMTQPLIVTKVGVDVPLIDTVVRRSREVDQSLATQIGGLGAERPLAITRESVEVLQDIRARVVDSIVRLLQGLVTLESAS
jgi:outer membrane lipopolysaccharide assembly protein LptE/RlpB